LARRFKQGDFVFWLHPRPVLTGIYRFKNEDNYPILTLTKNRDSRNYKAAAEAVFSLKEIEAIITHPSLEQFFSIEKELQEKQEEIDRLRQQLKDLTNGNQTNY